MSDSKVLMAQQWLNQTYGGVTGYGNNIVEDGLTGWGTINAMIRALQIELGITATANNFGPSTISKFNTRFPNGIIEQSSEDTTEDNIYGIIQCACWCKGYAADYSGITKHFYSVTGNAIQQLKSDAGCIDSSSTVTLNIMKALLSMDYFVCSTYAESDPQVRTIQQYLNRNYEDYIGICPCDGIYSRKTNTALIYALQAEEGLSTSIANGNFGPSTKSCCPTIPYDNVANNYQGRAYTTEEINRFTSLLQIALYVNGFGNGNPTDLYNSSIVSAFQSSYALETTGICSLRTWLALLISCGDTTRSTCACDCATILDEAKAQTLYNNGYRYVGRYLSGVTATGASKALTRSEINLAYNNGLRIFPIQQSSANTPSYFTTEQAKYDVKDAYYHARKLELPTGTVIYFAVDCDPQDTDITNYIIPYFQKINTVMSTVYNSKYRIGIYGTRNVCTRVSNNGYAEYSFVSDMSTGFSGNLGYKLPCNWAFDQFTTITEGSGNGKIEIDKDGYSGRDQGINVSSLDSLTRVRSYIAFIYSLALNYTNNNVERSSILVLHYLRGRGGYGTPGDSPVADLKELNWDATAGPLDDDFCTLVENNLGKLDIDFIDPVTGEPYSIEHFAATLNALLFPAAGMDLEGLDDIVDLFAGWAGDLVTFGRDIARNSDRQDLQSFSNELICSKIQDSHFSFEDYIGDIDAINIASLMDLESLTFPEAFTKYFTYIDPNTGYIYAKNRTERWIDSITFNVFFEQTADVLKDEFPMNVMRLMLIKNQEVTDEHLNIARLAFLNFVHDEYIAGR